MQASPPPPEGLARRVLRHLGIPVAKSALGIEDETRNTEKVIEL